MRTFAKKSGTAQQIFPVKNMESRRTVFGQSREISSIFHLQGTIGNQAVQRLLQSKSEKFDGTSTTIALSAVCRYAATGQRITVSAVPSSVIQRNTQEGADNDWQAQARKHAPWKEWTDKQKMNAMYEYRAARRGELERIMDPNKRKDTAQEAADQKVLELLDPYKKDIKKYDLSRTYTRLIASPDQESSYKQTVTFTATVNTSDGARPTGGRVRFDVVMAAGQLTLGNAPLVNGMACLSSNLLPKKDLHIKAEYFPYTEDLIGSSDEIRYSVK